MIFRKHLARAALCLALVPGSTLALEQTVFQAPGADGGLEDRLRAASLVLAAEAEGRTSAQEVFAAARADYGRFLTALYTAGFYSGTISILIDGREAADIAPLNAPRAIRTIAITVTPGPPFTFGRTELGPLAPGTDMPDDLRPGERARSTEVQAGVDSAVAGWRDIGHAKAAPGRQAITADHARRVLDLSVAILPGPQARFGRLTFTGTERMRPDRLAAIAGFPAGQVFSPADVARVADRLRRTGVFRSVSLTEAEALGPGNTLDIDAALIEEAPRRLGFGAELASLDGLSVSAYWLHRNLFGGAERLRFDASVAQIGAERSGTDYHLGVTFDRPATFTPDTTVGIAASIARLNEEDYTSDNATIGLNATHIFNDELTGRAALQYHYSRVHELPPVPGVGPTTYRLISLPAGVNWDRRNNAFDATAGFYLDAEAAPFLGFGSTDNGVRVQADGRYYRSIGDRIVLAGRLQMGAIYGASLAGTPRDYLFYSGGGGTVRGQPYQSLGVNVLRGGTQRTGGTHFLGASAEIRARVTERIGVVGFYDVGHVAADNFFDGSGASHAGAGIGLRYATGIGPIRLDVAGPVGGDTGRGVQVYIGIGQAF